MVSRADTCENLEARMPAVDHERTIRDYFDACTAGDARVIASFFAPDAVHYFPDGDTYPDGSRSARFVALTRSVTGSATALVASSARAGRSIT